jgi:uncharacterized protein YndB with AHSA1/START domain
MATKPEISKPEQPAPLVISRIFPASRELVFRAWTSAEHLARWFCPEGHSIPEARVEFRIGGAFDICMRSAQGREHWTRGKYSEIVPNSRLAIDMVPGTADRPLFTARLVATFEEQRGGSTRLEVTQTFRLLDAAAEEMIRGAPQGWTETLDRLEQEVGRIKQAAPANRSVEHATFSVERNFGATREQVFAALTDPSAKAKWFGGGDGYTLISREMDVRPGGRERVKGRWQSGIVSSFDAIYLDVVPNERIVYTYEMHLDERKISVSLATFELKAAGSGTHLLLTEQGAFLDGYDDAGSRERGTNFLVDALAASLG